LEICPQHAFAGFLEGIFSDSTCPVFAIFSRLYFPLLPPALSCPNRFIGVRPQANCVHPSVPPCLCFLFFFPNPSLLVVPSLFKCPLLVRDCSSREIPFTAFPSLYRDSVDGQAPPGYLIANKAPIFDPWPHFLPRVVRADCNRRLPSSPASPIHAAILPFMFRHSSFFFKVGCPTREVRIFTVVFYARILHRK